MKLSAEVDATVRPQGSLLEVSASAMRSKETADSSAPAPKPARIPIRVRGTVTQQTAAPRRCRSLDPSWMTCGDVAPSAQRERHQTIVNGLTETRDEKRDCSARPLLARSSRESPAEAAADAAAMQASA